MDPNAQYKTILTRRHQSKTHRWFTLTHPSLLQLFCFFFLLWILPLTGIAQTRGVRGIVTDEAGAPLPMVSIFIASERTGTTTNLEGNYEIPLDTGKYLLVFQSLGFARREFNLTIRNNWLDLNVMLQPQDYQLPEVKVYSSGEDPAYPIMRKAIGRAPYFLRQTQRYCAEVYLKGSFRMDKVPRLLKKSLSIDVDGAETNIEEGRTYTMESLNEISFSAPDTFKHTVLASRNSFPAGDESAAMGFINSSFYEPDNGMVISPLAPQAMRHYNFRYEGFFYEGEAEVDKIKVTPKRKSQQLMDGYLYIVDGLWNLHSVDLTNDAFFGTIRVKQLFQPVAVDAWLPVTHQFDLDVALMGVKAMVAYVGSVKYKEVTLNPDYALHENPDPITRPVEETPEGRSEEEKKRGQKDPTQKIEALLAQEELNNREMIRLARLMDQETRNEEHPKSLELSNNYQMKVTRDSAKRDSAFWETKRPVPLTMGEQKSFLVRDSLVKVKETETDSASEHKKNRLLKHLSQTLGGRKWWMADSSVTLTYDGLIGLRKIGFNPVDGWRYGQSLTLSWQQDSLHQLTLQPTLSYAFARKALMWQATLSQDYAPLKRGLLTLTGGQGSSDFKGDPLAVAPLANMAATLFFKENYNRYYNQEYINATNELDLFNGFRWAVSAGYRRLSPLSNHSDFSFFNKEKAYSPNLPGNDAWQAEDLMAQNELSWEMKFSYTPRYFYRIKKGRKVMSHSNYPTFFASLAQGIPTLDSRADYLLVQGGITKSVAPGFFPTFSWGAEAGWFARNNALHFSRYKHFNTSAIPVTLRADRTYRLLSDFTPSTRDWFLNAHLKYTAPYLLLKYLPGFSNRLWQESLHLAWLHTPQTPHYFQTGYSIDQIFFMGSLGIFAGFGEGEYQHFGVRATLAF